MPIEKIDTERCNGCEICVDGCPMDVIGFDGESKKAFVKYKKDCIACYNCEQDCPVEAVYVSPQRGTMIPPAW